MSFTSLIVPLFPTLSTLWADLGISSPFPLLAQIEESSQALSSADIEPFVLTSVLLSLVVIFLASKVGGELCARIDLPPVLGEL
ncbi:MAG: hypothetical protein ACO3NK_15430, partial [Prochlorotrichaceae cyanobacterium]